MKLEIKKKKKIKTKKEIKKKKKKWRKKWDKRSEKKKKEKKIMENEKQINEWRKEKNIYSCKDAIALKVGKVSIEWV